MVGPTGYEVMDVDTLGHPLQFREASTGKTYTPVMVAGKPVCAVCLAHGAGLQCTRSHNVLQIGKDDDARED